jgi:hypothetical protein
LSVGRNFEPIRPIPQWPSHLIFARTSMMDYQTGSNDATQPNAPRPPASLFSRALRRPGSYLKTLGLVGAVGGLALALVLADLNSRYQAAIDEAKHSAQGFAEVLAEHMARVFEAVDYSLQAAEAIRRDTEVGGNGAARPADHALRQLLQNSSVLASIHWTNANGDVVAHSSGSDPPHANVADLLYFIAQRDGIANGLFIAPPFRPTPEGRWIVTVSLPLRNADGSFAGVVAAELDQSYFRRIFQSMKPGPNGSVTLARRDGRIVAREPFDAAAMSRSIGGDDLFTRYLARAEAGALVKRSHPSCGAAGRHPPARSRPGRLDSVETVVRTRPPERFAKGDARQYGSRARRDRRRFKIGDP